MQRRKTLRNALRDVVSPEDFESVGIDPGLRPEQVPIGDYVRLGNHLERNSR
jgi:16S rRNA (adenine1518-N6/adenine1519-N6)-dimethyltransferase